LKGKAMPAPTTTSELLDLVRKSDLIPAPRLDTFIKQANAADPSAPPREMTGLLVAAGLLTQFQADQFLQGKWRGFTIGKYKVLERLGAGGMGTVYLCEHMMVGRRVAVKVLPTIYADNPSVLGRFYREARASGVLDHPNLVKCHDIDQDGGLHFLVMEYVDGSNLQEIVTRFGPLSPARAAHYISQTAIGLQHAHQCGLVHRDVKPANVLVERSGNVRLLDLGLARFFHDNTDLLTLKYDDNNVLGTADYVAPEQALNSHDVDIRADIYSLGATFYFCLTGQPPFPTGKVAQKLIWHQVRQPTPIEELRPDVPKGMAAVISHMMAKAPAQRYQAPSEVAEALAAWTDTPIPPPPETEMPRLSPAVAPPAPTPCSGAGISRPGGDAPTPGRGAAVASVRPVRGKQRSATAQETPCGVAAATPTATGRRRQAPAPVRPSQRLGAPEGSRQRQSLRLAIILLCGVVAGMALRFALVW
jgi:serine/threonine protein kinase